MCKESTSAIVPGINTNGLHMQVQCFTLSAALHSRSLPHVLHSDNTSPFLRCHPRRCVCLAVLLYTTTPASRTPSTKAATRPWYVYLWLADWRSKNTVSMPLAWGGQKTSRSTKGHARGETIVGKGGEVIFSSSALDMRLSLISIPPLHSH